MSAFTVAQVLEHLGISRLAHFTPAKNLWHIMQDGQVRSSKDLADNAPEYFSPTDHERFDSHPEMVCCSLEYPNAYYLAQARLKAKYVNYPDWVCLLLDRFLLLRPGVLFSGCNASRGGGVYLSPGGQALLDCYADPSIPAGYPRGADHHSRTPTDLQAEAQIPGPIDLSYLHGIVVSTEGDALDLFGVLSRGSFAPERFEWIIAPGFFNRLALRGLRDGRVIMERVWHPPEALGGAAA
jgi:hypothetical protein